MLTLGKSVEKIKLKLRLLIKLGCGGLVRDFKGDLISGFLANVGCSTVYDAEVWGLDNALNLAWDLGLKKVVIESDDLAVVQELTGRKMRDNSLHLIIYRIKNMIHMDWEVLVKYIPRHANGCANKNELLRDAFDYGVNTNLGD
ncbi:putative serine/threonine-protein kinase [Senna tora]|uniref:Putative serine/threonine-protein kinase n=1 Tax=Senna tora TaxID=362788 RepID=A0A834XB67_9FABA|nr:putative serine/threonine-protein kinase [Senna tora]